MEINLKQIYELSIEDPKLNPCQLKKLWGSGRIACSAYCAFINGCPIIYIDSHDQPLIKKISALDLEPIEGEVENM